MEKLNDERKRDRYTLLTITSTDLDSAKLGFRASKQISIFILITLSWISYNPRSLSNTVAKYLIIYQLNYLIAAYSRSKICSFNSTLFIKTFLNLFFAANLTQTLKPGKDIIRQLKTNIKHKYKTTEQN